jgi:hypothetical protein
VLCILLDLTAAVSASYPELNPKTESQINQRQTPQKVSFF